MLSEIVGFSRRAWTARFTNAGWRVMQSCPLGYFYTGYMLLAGRLGLGARARLSACLGSSSTASLVVPAAAKGLKAVAQ